VQTRLPFHLYASAVLLAATVSTQGIESEVWRFGAAGIEIRIRIEILIAEETQIPSRGTGWFITDCPACGNGPRWQVASWLYLAGPVPVQKWS
jgi:hypothetical protein